MENELEYRMIRLKKAEELKKIGINPYPARVKPPNPISEILSQFQTLLENQSEIRIAGRMVAFRGHGKSSFAHIEDGSGKIQIYFRYDTLGEEKYSLLKFLDIGDFLSVSGKVFLTHTGEKTVQVLDLALLAKSLLPLPEKWHGLKDPDLRYRKRHLDLISNPESKRIMKIRSELIRLTREFLNSRGFLEFETPILQPLYGGAFAKPFTTHFFALDRDLYLRIATELYLKRLIIGGFERVYELGKNFRNEGLDRFHNPEFTALEAYQAYTDYYGMMDLTESYMAFLAQKIKGSFRFTYQGEEVDFTPPFRRENFFEAIKTRTGIDVKTASEDELVRYCEEENIKIERKNLPKLMEKIFDEKVTPTLRQPTFILDYPVSISPFAKKKEGEDGVVERFEFFVLGMELANAFTELNDPIDQRQRFEEQLRLKTDDFVQEMDTDFLEAMEQGMPPCGGIGFGIDRIVMLFSDAPSIREVIPFPILK